MFHFVGAMILSSKCLPFRKSFYFKQLILPVSVTWCCLVWVMKSEESRHIVSLLTYSFHKLGPRYRIPILQPACVASPAMWFCWSLWHK